QYEPPGLQQAYWCGGKGEIQQAVCNLQETISRDDTADAYLTDEILLYAMQVTEFRIAVG
ncbi:MAG TPA: hypothetical protein VGJ21_05565, partial [Terracidiphilus sp.]